MDVRHLGSFCGHLRDGRGDDWQGVLLGGEVVKLFWDVPQSGFTLTLLN